MWIDDGTCASVIGTNEIHTTEIGLGKRRKIEA